ncbi:MAG: riboflavin synthase [Firmicutes bacterium]|nr:riboflavin synthase [Bacillota bacterium]
MFTGLVEEVGYLVRWQQGPSTQRLTIRAAKVMEDLGIDDSIAVNGLCLTVTALTDTTFTADVMPESLRRSNLGRLGTGSPVNLERALALGDRLGGHLVTGHIDGTGIINRITQEGNALLFEIESPPEVAPYLVAKGSVAIDGVSLTVASVRDKSFVVGVIPHTARCTTLGQRRPGDRVNLEGDLIGKYVENFLQGRKGSDITMDWLREQGFA